MADRFLRGICIGAACAALASCGGGGGGGPAASGPDGSNSNAITFTPSSLQIVQTQGFEESIKETVRIGPGLAGTQLFAIITTDKPVLGPGDVFLSVNPDDSATATAQTAANLAVGTYEGEFTVHLCRDSGCQFEVGHGVLPYSIKVLPRVQLEATGPSVSSGLGAPNDYFVDPDATVVVTSNIPVTWSKGSSITGADLQVIASTPTRWEGKILGSSRLFVGIAAVSIEKPEHNATQAVFTIR